MPLVEALYNGNYKVLDVFARKKIPLFAAARSWVAPLPVCPFAVPGATRAKAVTARLVAVRNRYLGNADKPVESDEDDSVGGGGGSPQHTNDKCTMAPYE